MTTTEQISRVHLLFNALGAALGELNDELATDDKPNPLYHVHAPVDAAHHDFTEALTS